MPRALLHTGWVDTDMGNRGGAVVPPLKPAESIAGVVAAMDAATPDVSGAFIDFAGGGKLEQVPW